MPDKPRVLIVDDQPSFRRLLARILGDEGYEVFEAQDGRGALELARQKSPHLVLSDVAMPRMDGMTLLSKLHAEMPETVVVLLTAYGTVPAAVEAMKHGAFDYLTKPLNDPDDVKVVAAKAMAQRRATDASAALQPAESGELVYEDAAMARAVEAVRRVAPVDATVLLTGESGTGKEVVARMLHAHSPRAGGPFVAVSCAALAETLLDSELFGHERGAFTGATARRRGRFEAADGGTLFLDEVGEMNPGLQVKLLRVLQERAFERVGGAETLEVDVRLVAATNRDLNAEVAEGRFREDLYYRLAVFPIHLPPLRERGRDVLVLARHFLARAARRHGRPELRLGGEAEGALLDHVWPGNVRELANVIERAAILAQEAEITAHDLAFAGPEPVRGGGDELPLNLKDLEKEAIARALEKVDGSRTKAAELLGIGLRTLHHKLNVYGLR